MVWRVAAVMVVVAVTGGGGGGSSGSGNRGSMLAAATTNMDDTVKDLYDPPPEGQQGRFFLNYDQAASFNTSVAFTIPLFSFTLPGAGDANAAGIDSETFGALAFIALFLLGGLGVALYTTSQGAEARATDDSLHQESILTRLVMESLSGLPNIVDAGSCARLAICGAHAEPQRYGLLAWPLKFFVPVQYDDEDDDLTSYQQAAKDGASGDRDCQYEYPCLVQPLDILIYIYDYWYGHDTI